MRAFLAVLIGFVWAGTAGAAQDMLSREAIELFVNRGDILQQFLPEFIAQIEVPVGVELGSLPPLGIYIPPTPADPEGGVDYTHLPAERTGQRFEFARGTVKEALDAFCKLNPDLQWRLEDGVVLIVRRRAVCQNLGTLLEQKVRLWGARQQPLDQALGKLEAAVNEAWPSKPANWPWKTYCEGWVPSEGVAWGNFEAPRRKMNQPITIDVADATFRRVLGEFAKQCPGGFWMAYDQRQGEVDEKDHGREGVVIVSNAAPTRRKMDLHTLVRCLDRKYTNLHDYANIGVRIEDAQRELGRRHHFHTEEVQKALLEQDAVPNMMQTNEYLAMPLLLWLFSLRDQQLALPLVDRILATKNRDIRWSFMVTFFGAIDHDSESTYLAIWKNLVNDDDPRVSERARRMVKLWDKPAAQVPRP